MSMIRQEEFGRSMIEMLGVLAIIGILSAGGIAGYTMAMKNYRANKAMEKFQTVSSQIVTYFPMREDFTDLADDVLAMNVDLSTPYNGTMTVSGGEAYFTLAMANVPEEACIKIAQAQWGSDFAIGTNEDRGKFTKNPFACVSERGTVVLTYQPEIASSLNADNA